MNLSDRDVQEFADIWEREFGECLSADEARHQASRLLALYETLTEPANMKSLTEDREQTDSPPSS